MIIVKGCSFRLNHDSIGDVSNLVNPSIVIIILLQQRSIVSATTAATSRAPSTL